MTLPKSIIAIAEYKRRFSFVEMYLAFVASPIAMINISKNKKKRLLDNHFIERLQLAVTQVNGCVACSYAHTYMALKQGMSNEEINSFLNGDGKFIYPQEAKAIMFAQHFANSRGVPKKDAYQAIVDEYGEQKAKIILSAVQMMIAGNIYGLPYSAFSSRLKGKAYKNSSLFYELGMLIFGLLILPVALIHGVLRALFGFSNIKFDKK